MHLIGKTSIHPFLFYTGKISGYCTWILFFLAFSDIEVMARNSLGFNDILSYILLGTSMFLVILSLINLGSSTRLGIPTEETVLKTEGLYKVTRNPMYLGFNLLTIASMIYFLNFFIVLPGFYSIIIYHFIIKGEERFLENRFTEDYLKYKKKVRRYL